MRASLDAAEALLSQLSDGNHTPDTAQIVSTLQACIAQIQSLRTAVSSLEEDLETSQALADRDPLCPVLNRRAFVAMLEQEISRAERHGYALSLLFVDLDHFKRINDTKGHEEGDRVLVAVAQALNTAVRQGDTVGRLGGDEFAIILPHTHTAAANTCIDHLKAQLLQADIVTTASIGVGSWTLQVSATQLLALADRDMFTRKSRKNSPIT